MQVTPEGPSLQFTVFVPRQEFSANLRAAAEDCEPLPSTTAEVFDIYFSSDGDAFEGSVRVEGLSPLPTEGHRQNTPESRAARLPVLVQDAPSDGRFCPICLEEWGGLTCVETSECHHRFCMACVMSSCAMAPPMNTGSCPLCRAPVTLDGLVRVHWQQPPTAGTGEDRGPSHC